ncbi:DedA family protein [Salinibacterium hongtaonis]|uniref:DedA family protein n=1 Tax=Homoserinimonas hongtaonis TaxID=2079791 RepID=A0A2U1SZ21_9MICO|nr:DedA family protein [Salinibacterium hongtaonis]PWB96871.1 DedA family protein [Salinibacterium hongtaonis]
MNEILDWILEVVQSVDPVLRTIIAGIAILLETSVLVGLVVPGDTVVLVSATAVSSVAEYVWLLVAVVVGALIGESIGFALGRFFGPSIRTSRVGRWIGEKHWVSAQNYTDRRAGIAVFVSRFLPVLHSLVPLTVGMSTMRYRTFIAWTAPACVLWATGYITVGWLAAGSYRELSEQLHTAGYIFVGIIAAFLLLVVVGKRLLHRLERRYMQHPGDGDATTVDEDPADTNDADADDSAR